MIYRKENCIIVSFLVNYIFVLLNRYGSKTAVPNSANTSGHPRSSCQWAWCQGTGHCWGGCVCSPQGLVGSTTPTLWPTSPALHPCCPLVVSPTTRVLPTSVHAPQSHLSRLPPASKKSGTTPWGPSEPRPPTLPRLCSPWLPCLP